MSIIIGRDSKGRFVKGITQILSDEDKINRSKAFSKRQLKLWEDSEYRKNHYNVLKGKPTWNKGKKMPEEQRQKMIGRSPSAESRKKMSEHNGMKRPEIRKKVSASMMGRPSPRKGIKTGKPAWNKGLKWSESTIQKIIKNNGARGKAPWNKGKEWKEIQGEKHHNWQGGLSFIPYCPKFNGSLRKRIRDRDNHTCQLCGVKENGEKLAVHHVSYDKPNCYPYLVSLCRKCHGKTQIKHDYWEEYFMNLLRERGLLI